MHAMNRSIYCKNYQDLEDFRGEGEVNLAADLDRALGSRGGGASSPEKKRRRQPEWRGGRWRRPETGARSSESSGAGRRRAGVGADGDGGGGAGSGGRRCAGRRGGADANAARTARRRGGARARAEEELGRGRRARRARLGLAGRRRRAAYGRHVAHSGWARAAAAFVRPDRTRPAARGGRD